MVRTMQILQFPARFHVAVMSFFVSPSLIRCEDKILISFTQMQLLNIVNEKSKYPCAIRA